MHRIGAAVSVAGDPFRDGAAGDLDALRDPGLGPTMIDDQYRDFDASLDCECGAGMGNVGHEDL